MERKSSWVLFQYQMEGFIHLVACKVLSNEQTRIKYDRALKFQKDTGRLYRVSLSNSPEFEDKIRMYNRWVELRRKMQYERYWKRYNSNKEYSSFYGETTDEEIEVENLEEERPFSRVLRSAFISLCLLKIFGYQLSLTYSSLLALFDHKLDSGYKVGYLIAWIFGGRGGIFLTLCLSFASWVWGKTSSGMVVLVVVAMWVGSNLT